MKEPERASSSFEFELQRLRSFSSESIASTTSASDAPTSASASLWGRQSQSYVPILYVLFLEFLAISLTKSLIPKMLVDCFGDKTYFIVGVMETAKGLLAFLSCPAFGRLSDRIGRKPCLLVTVIGTTLPVCILAFTVNMYVHTVMLAISGIFSATFPLTFAYIADCVSAEERAPAYGLALATFGLSFTLGPLVGSYVAQTFGDDLVFVLSCLLVVANVAYITLYLPETVTTTTATVAAAENIGGDGAFRGRAGAGGAGAGAGAGSVSQRVKDVLQYLPHTWDLKGTFRVFGSDPFMTNLAIVVVIYYTAVWAIVSTLMVYVTRQLSFDPVTLGWLLSGYGVATMVSEGVLVRLIVPCLGEMNSIRLGLLAFSIQCTCVAFSSRPAMVFVSMLFSMLSNLVYPSVSSLVSKVVPEEKVGEALGALNGIKALTEGFGPLFFGLFMSLYEKHPTPGAPYLLASVLTMWAFLHCWDMPQQPELAAAKFYARQRGEEDGTGLLEAEADEE